MQRLQKFDKTTDFDSFFDLFSTRHRKIQEKTKKQKNTERN